MKRGLFLKAQALSAFADLSEIPDIPESTQLRSFRERRLMPKFASAEINVFVSSK